MPPELQMLSDNEYEHYEGYSALPPLKGVYVTGRRSGHPSFSDELRKKAPRKRCNSSYKLASQLPEDENEYVLYEWPEVQFWFYRHDNQILYIELRQEAYKETNCILELRPELQITRGIMLRDRLTSFRAKEEVALTFEITKVDGSFDTQIPIELLFDRLSIIESSGHPSRKRRVNREPEGKPLLKGIKEQCYDTSNGLDGGIDCYISSPGLLYGLKSYSTFHYHVVGGDWYDDSVSFWEFVEVKPKSELDSRLFEWDREITLKSK